MSLIKITIAGDFCPILRVERLLEERKQHAILADISDGFLQSDLVVANLECPITNAKTKIQKSGPHLKAKPAIMGGLRELGITLFTMANNHIMDYGSEGLHETLELLKNSGLSTVGAGLNYPQASRVLTKEVKGKKIAFLNIAENEFGIATQELAGANPIDPYQNYSQVRFARENSDFLIAIIHGGNEYFNLPNPFQKKAAHFYCDMGADVVVFHHSHSVSGMEKYKGSIIFYGLGNFIFDWRSKQPEDWYVGAYLELQLGQKCVENFALVPVEQCKKKPEVKALDSFMFNEKIDELTKIIACDESLAGRWLEYLQRVAKYYHYNVNDMNLLKKVLYRIGVTRPFIKRKITRPEFINVIQCESHREALINIIRKRM